MTFFDRTNRPATTDDDDAAARRLKVVASRGKTETSLYPLRELPSELGGVERIFGTADELTSKSAAVRRQSSILKGSSAQKTSAGLPAVSKDRLAKD